VNELGALALLAAMSLPACFDLDVGLPIVQERATNQPLPDAAAPSVASDASTPARPPPPESPEAADAAAAAPASSDLPDPTPSPVACVQIDVAAVEASSIWVCSSEGRAYEPARTWWVTTIALF
jgi:hypothetical protein